MTAKMNIQAEHVASAAGSLAGLAKALQEATSQLTMSEELPVWETFISGSQPIRPLDQPAGPVESKTIQEV